MTIYNKERKNKIYLFNRFIFDSVSIKCVCSGFFSTNIGPISKINVMDLNGFKLINGNSLLMRNVH